MNEERAPTFKERNRCDGNALRPTILLYPTGVYFTPYDPDPAHLDIRCLAHGLAGTNRFNGHTRDLMNVAHHSVIVSLRIEAVEGMSMPIASRDIPMDPQSRAMSELDQGFKQTENVTKDRSNAPLKGLLHDSPEGVSGFGDVAGPVKHHERIKEAIEWVEGRISDAIAMNYGLPRGFSSEACVKAADTWAYHWENRDLRGINPPEGVMLPSEKLVPLDRDKARGVFLCRYMELTCREIGEVPWSFDIDSGRFWLVEMRRILAALCGGALVSK